MKASLINISEFKHGEFKYSVGLIIVIIFVLFLFGCSKQEVSDEVKLPYVELDLYLIGDEPEDTNLVYEELNKLLKVELNTKVNVHFISWEEREQKYSQVLSSGINVDLIYTADWCFYDEQARIGTFKQISLEDIKTFMPQTYENQPEFTFEQGMIDGRMYMIPNYQEEFAEYKVVMIRGDLRKKYNIKPLETLEDYYNYLMIIAENEQEISPYHVATDNKELSYIGFWQQNGFVRVNTDNKTSSFAIQYTHGETDYELKNILEQEAYLNYLKEVRLWQENHLWNEDAIANKVSAQTAFEEGLSASLIWNVGSLNLSAIKMNQDDLSYEPEIYDLTKSAPKIIAKYTNNGVAIATKSKNYERSLMVLDKLKNDKRYWNLTWLGIEGVHWESVNEQEYKVLDGGKRYPYAKTSCWGWGNKPFQRVALSTPKDSQLLVNLWSQNYTEPLTHFFRFDDASVRDISAQILYILSRYQPILELGMVADVEGTYNEMMRAIDDAGWEQYENEFQRQYEEFMKERLK